MTVKPAAHWISLLPDMKSMGGHDPVYKLCPITTDADWADVSRRWGALRRNWLGPGLVRPDTLEWGPCDARRPIHSALLRLAMLPRKVCHTYPVIDPLEQYVGMINEAQRFQIYTRKADEPITRRARQMAGLP